jgi:small subunit ribosomal protein S17
MVEDTKRPRGQRKVRTGVVVSDRMLKTVVVELTRQFAHPLYGKRITRTKRVHAHDELGAKTGDTVRLMETRPLSKLKRWRVTQIVSRAE